MSLRRCITALAVLALFAGLASAQVPGGGGTGPFQCSVSAAVPPMLRAEGLTELVGDIVLTCGGGAAPAIGSVIPTVNISVSFGANVTSRLFTYSPLNPATAANTSEALLLIDEPGSGLSAPPGDTGFGPEAPQLLCTTTVGSVTQPASGAGASAGGCVEYVRQAADFVMSSSSTSTVAGPNVFAGVVSANQVAFYGVPIMPPVVAGVSRVFRMTNMRINANAFPAGTIQVNAFVSIAGPSSVPVNNPVQTVGFLQSGLIFQVRTPDNSAVLTTPSFSGCVAGAACRYGTLRFRENFGTATKLRPAPSPQNVPGMIYNTESGFYNPGLGAGLSTAGLADFATRFKASFQSVPTGVHVWVGTSALSSSAALTQTEGGPLSAVAPTATYSGLGAVQRDTSTGSAAAVWEVTTTNPIAVDTFDFPVWIVFDSGVTLAALNIAGKLAPSQDDGAFSMPSGGAAQNATYPMPRFASLQPSEIGTYNAGVWKLDTNGNGIFDSGTDRNFFLGFPGAIPVLGDWNKNGRTKAGVYSNGMWFLDYDGNGVWDGGVVDKQVAWGWPGATPVVGDWNGDGKTKIGVYFNGFWFLDYDGNYAWDGGVVDKQVGLGWSGATPVVGDWNGNGKTKIGVYFNGFWFLDYDGNYAWDGGVVDKQAALGWAGATPIVGDWNGDGKTKIGVYAGGYWYVDYDGNYVWEYPANDKIWTLGWTGTTPVVGDWNGDGKSKAGVFFNGYWYLDYNGNGTWDGATTDRLYAFGLAGDTPVVGRW